MPTKLTLSIQQWHDWYTQFAQPGFIDHDPIQFPHRYGHLNDWRHQELMGFLAAMMSYGNRKAIVSATQRILPKDVPPLDWLMNSSSVKRHKQLEGWVYRFYTANDMVTLLDCLATAYDTHNSLKTLWQQAWLDAQFNLPLAIHRFRYALLASHKKPLSYGLRYMLADPINGSCAKRFNMFLRWMVRQDVIDLGLWQDVMPAAQLIFPLDVHVANTARRLNLLKRKSNDWKAAEDITQYFKTVCPDDPVKFDLVLFQLGLEHVK